MSLLAVLTQTGSYLVNQEDHWIQRVAGDPSQETPGFVVHDLRLDSERIPLIKMVSDIKVGEDMVMLLDVVQDGMTVTVRRTTPVREIIEVGTTPTTREEESDDNRND